MLGSRPLLTTQVSPHSQLRLEGQGTGMPGPEPCRQHNHHPRHTASATTQPTFAEVPFTSLRQPSCIRFPNFRLCDPACSPPPRHRRRRSAATQGTPLGLRESYQAYLVMSLKEVPSPYLLSRRFTTALSSRRFRIWSWSLHASDATLSRRLPRAQSPLAAQPSVISCPLPTAPVVTFVMVQHVLLQRAFWHPPSTIRRHPRLAALPSSPDLVDKVNSES